MGTASRLSAHRSLLGCVIAVVISLLGAAPAIATPATVPPDADSPAAGAATVTTGNDTIPARWIEAVAEQDWAQENPYLDCDSLAVRRPGCGSKDRGGWRQTLVFVAVLGGLVAVAGRIAYAVRTPARRRPATDQPQSATGTPAPGTSTPGTATPETTANEATADADQPQSTTGTSATGTVTPGTTANETTTDADE